MARKPLLRYSDCCSRPTRMMRRCLKTMFPLTRKEPTMQYKTICPRTAPATAGDARPAPQEAEAAADAGTLRQRAEDQPRSLEGTAVPGEAGQRPRARSRARRWRSPSRNWRIVCLPRLRRTRTSRCPSTQQWRSSAVTRRPRKGVTPAGCSTSIPLLPTIPFPPIRPRPGP